VQSLQGLALGKTKVERLTFKKKLRDFIMHSDTVGPIFWKLWFWYGIRKATKERKLQEAEDAKREPMTNDEYWEKVHNDRDTNI